MADEEASPDCAAFIVAAQTSEVTLESQTLSKGLRYRRSSTPGGAGFNAFSRFMRMGVALSLAALVFSACSDLTIPTETESLPTASDPGAGPPSPPAPTAPWEPRRTIIVGEAVSGTIKPENDTCSFWFGTDGWEGICNAFAITAPATGTLKTTARWEADAPLALFAKTSTGEQVDLACCAAPIVMELPVDSGSVYHLELAYVGRPRGYPNVLPVTYSMETALLESDAQSSRVMRAVVLGDAARTQHLPFARIEVLDGPSAGAVAKFDEATGLYELANLPGGSVEVLVSADAFIPLGKRVPVGTNVPLELVLQRREELPNSINTLTGVTWAGASSAYTGVKVEIVDGPLAGVFTFTDEWFGMYYFRGLPPGSVSVRATSERLQPQILSVVVSGDTRLDFHLQQR